MLSSKRLSRILALGCAMLICLTGSVVAQNATLTGTVTDAETGEALPGANVAVTSGTIQTGAAATTSGAFEVPGLRPGTYTIRISFIGYETQVMENVVLSAGESRSIDVALELTGIELNPISISASRRAEKALEAPASISVIEPKEITQMVAPSSASLLANVTGVDMATTGIDRREIVMRGFSNAFSGAAYILTDYRRAAVPSLDVNLHSIMPNMAIDLEKVEVVRGPGSALYGAGVDAGVVHYLTKDPFSYPGTTLSFSGGERSSIAGHLRHAGIIGENVGYKLTAQFAKADDWDYDPADKLDSLQLATLQEINLTNFDRNYEKVNVNGLFDFKLTENTRLVAAGGFSSLDATVLSGIGTVQAKGYGYTYGQLRLQSGNFFAQAFMNKNDAGDSFVYGQLTADQAGKTPVVDKSTEFSAQAQYDLSLAEDKHQLIFGLDYDRVTPVTEGTIFGRNENNDRIEEFGAYVQSTSAVTDKLDFTAALRADYNNIEEDFQFSPRAALVLKASPGHTLRATYNRAYSLPGGNSLHLDIVGDRTPIPGTPFEIVQRGRGSRNGFSFSNARAGGGITAASYFPAQGLFGQDILQYPAAGGRAQNFPLAAMYGLMYQGLAGIPLDQLQGLLQQQGLPQIPLETLAGLVALLRPAGTPDPTGQGLPATNVQGLGTTRLEALPEDVEPLKSTITQTIEAGYKGLINDKLLLAVDVYYSKKKNFISGVTQLTPLAWYTLEDGTAPILDEGELLNAIAAGIEGNAGLTMARQLLGLSSAQVAGLLVTMSEPQLRSLLASLPAGVVQPNENSGAEILGGYRNFGDVDFWGIDASFQFLASNHLNFFGNMSIVSDDFFDNKELGVNNPAIFLALNASKFKLKGGFNYSVPQGLSFNAAARFTQAFPVASGPYIGGLPIANPDDIGGLKDYFLLDVGAGYDMSSLSPGLRFDVSVQNILNNEHREFIGAPEIGRLALARLTYSIQ